MLSGDSPVIASTVYLLYAEIGDLSAGIDIEHD